MAQNQSIFDRLRSMQTEGLPLHTLIVEACEVGNELLALVTRYRDETPLGHQPHMIAHRADAAIARAHPENGNGDNGSNRSAA